MDTYVLHKREDLCEIQLPQQATWMIRQIMAARDTIALLHSRMSRSKSFIRQVYNQLLSAEPTVIWKFLVFKDEEEEKPDLLCGCTFLVNS